MTNFEFYRDWESAHKAWNEVEKDFPNLKFSQWLYIEHCTIVEKTVYTSKLFTVVEKKDKSGLIKVNPIVGINSRDWVTVIVEKDGKFLMEKQLRFGLMKDCEEFPSGIVEKDDRSFEFTAHRELFEETGYDVDPNDFTGLGVFAANPAFMSNHMHYFYVNLDKVGFTQGISHPDANEKIEFYWKDKNAAYADYMKGTDSVFAAGAYLLLAEKGIFIPTHVANSVGKAND